MAKKLMVLVVVIAAIASTSAGAHAALRTGVNGKNAFLPALMNAAYGGYTTAIYVENVSHIGAAANVTITYYNAMGVVVGVGDTGMLPFWSERTFRQDNGHSFATGAAGWGVLSSDQEVAVFVNEFAPGSGHDGSSYTAVQVSGGGPGIKLYAPAIANNAYGGYTTGIGLANTGSSSANVRVDYRDASGTVAASQMVTIAAFGYAGLYSGDPALMLPSGFAGTATITNTSPLPTELAAVVNETGPGGQFSSYDAVSSVASTLYAPAAMNNAYGGYNTGMGIMSGNLAPQTVTITYYDAMGNPAATVMKSLPADGYIGVYQGGPDGPPASATGYTATITGSNLAGIVNEVGPGGTLSTSVNMETAGSGYLNFALVENAGSDGWSTGLALMNITAATLAFTLTYFDATTGSALNSVPLSLPAHGYMGRYTPSDIVTPGTRATAWFFSATPGLAGIANEAGTGTLMSFNGQ